MINNLKKIYGLFKNHKKYYKIYKIGVIIGRMNKYQMCLTPNEFSSLLFYNDKLNNMGYKTSRVVKYIADKGMEYGEEEFVIVK